MSACSLLLIQRFGKLTGLTVNTRPPAGLEAVLISVQLCFEWILRETSIEARFGPHSAVLVGCHTGDGQPAVFFKI